ncbi:GNAT family N-acetyltransferase [Tatumella ptyseos]|nr:GNAT family N-acetyltransferase [Tatumella ptyseos]WKX26417.1 GNAT family N-acetyltransferase [Tatumella ptyseos]
MGERIFSLQQPLGHFTLRRWQVGDETMIHHWVIQPHAQFWGMQDQSVEQVNNFYINLVAQDVNSVLIGCLDGHPYFLIECYQALQEEVAEHYPAQSGDYGMHLLVAPVSTPIKGLSRQIFATVMEYMFSRPEVARVVVEPDVNNHKIHRLNQQAGFRYHQQIDLGHKRAWLAFCTATDFYREKALMLKPATVLPPAQPNAKHWQQANGQLIQKAITEFSHERLLVPEAVAEGGWRLTDSSGENVYQFEGKWRVLNHLSIDWRTLRKTHKGQEKPLDALNFIVEFADQLAIPESMLATYLEEVSSTLCSSQFKLQKGNPSSDQLAAADFQTIESSMTEGHPCFIANNGRIGFDAADYLAYAPEVGASIYMLWVAVHRSNGHFAAIDGLDYATLIEEELGAAQVKEWEATLRLQGVLPEDYLFTPVHPWQWQNKIVTVFAADIAQQKIIYLGAATDAYQAQQSIRTFFNRSQPSKRYVKTALSILNMGFMRGLSPYYMATTPAVNQWLAKIVAEDNWLSHCSFSILQEVATIGYHHRLYEKAIKKESAYKKMFAALWRENPLTGLTDQQRLMTMAGLLHRDAEGKALLTALIKRSGLAPAEWIDRYLQAYLSPILHCFYQYDLVFMPHGENLILKLEDDVPVGCFMKDIGEEIAILDTSRELPDKIQRIKAEVPDELKLLSIFVDVFSCFFRFISAILDEDEVMQEGAFWQRVAVSIEHYQRHHPQFADKFARFDLFSPTYAHSCLNRLQLANNQQMVNLDDPASALKLAGVLVNPIAQFKK